MTGPSQRPRPVSRGRESQNGRHSGKSRSRPPTAERKRELRSPRTPPRSPPRTPPCSPLHSPPRSSPPQWRPAPPQRPRYRAQATWGNWPPVEDSLPFRRGLVPGEHIMISIGTESASSLESYYLRPAEILFTSSKNALSSQYSQSSMTRFSSPELGVQAETDRMSSMERFHTSDSEVEAKELFPVDIESAFRLDALSESEMELRKLRSISIPSSVNGAPPLKISLNHVRSLPPREQAKLPRSAILAARLDAIPDVNYSKKYGFKPLKSLVWTCPRYIASSFLLDRNSPCPYETPEYLKDVVRPISALKHFTKPWWVRVRSPSRIDVVKESKSSVRHLDDLYTTDSCNKGFDHSLEKNLQDRSRSSFGQSTSSIDHRYSSETE